ncbi:MAG: family N-acetyltransferase [Alphaproteobacteria bacterium]|nr:family N-acetyltransferase [Alphaproteobacteria bacterium]
MTIDVALFRDLDIVARDAGAGLGRAAQPSLFDRLDWYRLVDEDMPDSEPLVVRARNGVGRCWLFLVNKGRSAWSLNNGYSLRYGSVRETAPGGEAPLAGIVQGLRRAGVSHVYLSPMAANDPLVAVLKRSGWAVHRSAVNVSWQIDTTGMRFEDYWAGRPSRLRNTVARKARKVELDIRILDRFDARAMDDYESVYDASWKPPEGARQLIRQMAIQEGEAGALRLGVAYHQGRPVACQLWIVEHGHATIHKLAYREDARELAAGNLLSVEMFRRVLDVDRVAMIDFGIGNHSYKAEWMTHSVPLYAVTAYDMLRPAGVYGVVKAAGGKLASRLMPGARQPLSDRIRHGDDRGREGVIGQPAA